MTDRIQEKLDRLRDEVGILADAVKSWQAEVTVDYLIVKEALRVEGKNADIALHVHGDVQVAGQAVVDEVTQLYTLIQKPVASQINNDSDFRKTIQGPKGPPGADGTNGNNGKDGTNGKNGKNGKDGKDGKQGDQGPDCKGF